MVMGLGPRIVGAQHGLGGAEHWPLAAAAAAAAHRQQGLASVTVCVWVWSCCCPPRPRRPRAAAPCRHTHTASRACGGASAWPCCPSARRGCPPRRLRSIAVATSPRHVAGYIPSQSHPPTHLCRQPTMSLVASTCATMRATVRAAVRAAPPRRHASGGGFKDKACSLQIAVSLGAPPSSPACAFSPPPHFQTILGTATQVHVHPPSAIYRVVCAYGVHSACAFPHSSTFPLLPPPLLQTQTGTAMGAVMWAWVLWRAKHDLPGLLVGLLLLGHCLEIRTQFLCRPIPQPPASSPFHKGYHGFDEEHGDDHHH